MTDNPSVAFELTEAEWRALSEHERRVMNAIAKRIAAARNANVAFDATQSFGDRLADRVAVVGGSWGFVSGFGLFLVVWAGLNLWLLPRAERFDPYPFIFLNLLLSMLAAIQAPIIMMSQNRQSQKDRLASQLDYEVNLKAELEVGQLHHKLDDLLQVMRSATTDAGGSSAGPA